MKSFNLLNTAFVVSLLVFNYFFWEENLGINLSIFSILLIAMLFINYKKAFSSSKVKITLVGTLIASVMVIIFNSTESKFAQIFSFLLMVAFIHETELKSVIYAALHMANGILMVPVNFFKKKNDSLKEYPRLNSAIRILRLSLIPLSIAFIFFMLYCFANPIFGNYANIAFEKFVTLLHNFFSEISFERIFFIIFGAILLSAIYFRNEVKIFLLKDLSFQEKLERVNKYRKSQSDDGFSKLKKWQPVSPAYKTIALKNQNRRGIILFLLVNVLLLIENCIDIKWLWFGFDLPEGFSLKHYVREGTGFLIVSILLSMGLLLYYFRKNQNFYSNNRLLKRLAYLWIVQNAILCYSVFLRNFQYIDFHGLAYKRIGVDVFLLLTVIGLITIFIKIKEIKSVYYLLRINTWALYITVILLSCYSWDVKIAEYNLAHWNKGEIDVDFYLKLSDKAMPVIFKNLNSVKEQIEAHKKNRVRWIEHLDYDVFVHELEVKRINFLSTYKEHSWLSYNMADEIAYKELDKREVATAIIPGPPF